MASESKVATAGGPWQFYLRSLDSQPLLTKACTSGVLNALEELLAQRLKGESIDWEKIMKKALYGFTTSAVLGHYLYALVDRVFAGREGTAASLGKLALINVAVLPITNWVYYAALAEINRMSAPATQAFIKANLWPTLVLTWKYFTPLQLLIVRLVPQPLWLPIFNLIGFVFGVYLNAAAAGRKRR